MNIKNQPTERADRTASSKIGGAVRKYHVVGFSRCSHPAQITCRAATQEQLAAAITEAGILEVLHISELGETLPLKVGAGTYAERKANRQWKEVGR